MPSGFDLPDHLTSQQRDAILHHGGPLLIIAGPGSGKTEVLTWRVARLVRSGLDPACCLVCTFARKAALELQDRIQRKLPDVDVRRMPVSTIHSLCSEILRDYQIKSPVARGFEIIDDDDQLLIAQRYRTEIGLGKMLKGRPEDFYRSVLRMFNLATEELVAPGGLREWCGRQQKTAEAYAAEMAGGKSKTKAQKAADAVEMWKEEAIITDAYRSYCELLRSRNLVDFAFLQRYCLDLLDSHPEVTASLRERYRAILVDEYQDTNAAQERILQHLAGDGHHLTVVGDDDQGIYRFRGATVGNLLAFEKRYPGARRIYLERNFRSFDPIVKGSLAVISNNHARFPKDLFTAKNGGSEVVLVYETAVAEEARAIAHLLKGLKAVGKVKRWDDVALLLRSVRSYCSDYLNAFAEEEIPATVTGEAGFFSRDDISQLCNLFNFLGATKPWADVHVRCPLMDLTEATRSALEAYKGSLEDMAGDSELATVGVHHASDRAKILRLLDLRRRCQQKKHDSVLSVFYELLSLAGYVQKCQRSGDAAALMNLGIFSRLVSRFDNLAGTRTLYPFQEYLDLLGAGGVEGALPAKPERSSNYDDPPGQGT